MNKDKLGNQLFEMYFINQEGVGLSDLVNLIKPIKDIYDGLHIVLNKLYEYFDEDDYVDLVKIIEYNSVHYLFVKLSIYEYIVIDLFNKKTLNKNEIFSLFDEEFFCNNLNERRIKEKSNYIRFYEFMELTDNLFSIINYCLDNYEILELKNRIRYFLNISDAVTSININLVTGKIYLSFHTPDQFLYEHLWINPDLTPSNMQDAISKIGINKMNEMFTRIKDIIIPYDVIPNEIYENNKVFKK